MVANWHPSAKFSPLNSNLYLLKTRRSLFQSFTTLVTARYFGKKS